MEGEETESTLTLRVLFGRAVEPVEDIGEDEGSEVEAPAVDEDVEDDVD